MRDWRPEIRNRLDAAGVPPREGEVIEELAQHLDDRYHALLAEGFDEGSAHRMALDDLDAPEELEQPVGPGRPHPAAAVPGLPRAHLLADLWLDIRYALRTLRKQPGFTLAVILTMGLGIGANTAIFSLVNATLFQRLPAQAPDELAYIYIGQPGNVLPYPLYAALRDGQTSAAGLAAWGGISASLNTGVDTDLVSGVIVTGNFFDLLGAQPARGRLLSPEDDRTPGGHPVAVISDGLWSRAFGRRHDIVGQQVLLNGHSFTIVGVTQPAFIGPQVGVVRDLYVPMMMQAIVRPPRAGYSGEMDPDLLRNPRNGWLFGLARLKPSVSAAQASSELSILATNFARTQTPSAPARTVPVVPIAEDNATERQRLRSVAWLLGGVVLIVLLIACVNVANLLLSRAAARRREFAVRLAVGANRWRLVRQLLTEAVLLGIGGGGLGLLLAWSLIRATDAMPPPDGALPLSLQLELDRRVLAFAAAISVLTGIVFGLMPAWTASRPKLVPALKDDGAADGGGRLGLKRALAIVEVAASLVLLLAGGLFVRSLHSAYAIDPGLDVPRLVSAPVSINLLRYTREQGRAFYDQAVARVGRLPGVESAALARVPLFGGTGRVLGFLVEGRPGRTDQVLMDGRGLPGDEPDTVRANVVTPDFFKTVGISLQRGRTLSGVDREGAPLAAVISAAAERRYFTDADAIGQRVSFTGPDGPWVEIVGVVEDSDYARLGEDPTPVAYLPLAQNHETGMVLYARTLGAPAALVPEVRRALQGLEPNLPVPDVQTVAQTVATSLYVPRMGAWLLTGFAMLSLVLAAVGVYGVLAFASARRTREFGIRVALGATAGDVFRLVLRDGLLLVGVGAAGGVVIGLVFSESLSRFLYGVDTNDLSTFATATIALLLVSAVACIVPARRATRVDPLRSLRAE